MKKFLFVAGIGLMSLFLVSCEEDDKDLSPQLAGFWQQEQTYIDDVPQTMSAGELNTMLIMDANGVYRLYDGVRNQERPGTWLFSDGDWLNLTMDKIASTNSSGVNTFGQVLVRFTILNVDATTLELRIKTYLFERKKTVMFNLMDQDNTSGMTGEEKLALDTQNKEQHTYRYVFKRINL